MKKSFFIFGLLFVSIWLLFSFKSTSERHTSNTPASSNPNDSFLIGSFDMGWFHQFYENSDLGFNIWHVYTNRDTIRIDGKKRAIPTGWMYIDTSCSHDSLFTDKSLYESQVSNIITRNKNYGYFSLFERPKLEYLIRSQRSIYQCENVSVDGTNNTEWWYAFNYNGTGTDIQDSNKTVKYCEMGSNNAGYVDSNIRCKYEQTALFGQNSLYADNNYFWYVKPRIRIQQGLPDTTSVCRIEILNYDGDMVLEKKLTVNNFMDNNNNYYGQYEETFNWWSPNNKDSLRIDGDTLVKHNAANTESHFDIRIYWYGICNMWIDYVKVETDVATDLFNGIRNDWIQNEAQNIGGTDGAFRFWVDEPDVNMLPSIYYLQRKIKGQYNPNTPMLVTEYSAQYTPNWWDGKVGNVLYNARMDSLNNNEIISASYPLRGYHLVPDVLQSSGFNRNQGLLGVPADRNEYEDSLQLVYYDGETGLLSSPWKGLQYAKQHNKRFIFVPQVHLYLETFDATTVNMHREPTNEEIESMVNILVSYGATGILYYEYGAWGNFTDAFFCRGLHSFDDNQTPKTFPRHENVYHQDKWAKVVEIDKKLKKWGNYLVKFNNNLSQSYKYYDNTDRENLLNNTFIKEALTYPNGNPSLCPNLNPDYDVPDALSKRYLQVAVFKKDNENYEKYFMMVNRRSAPGNDACGGYRKVKVQLDSMASEFSAFNNWKIINLYNDSLICTFNKQITNTIDLGWYNPGEARLYKIVPVMKAGGNLICNESFSGQTFTNDSMVYGNGYDITIGSSNIISFKNIGGIVMNGGSFKCGTKFSYQAVTLQGASYWNGLELNGCDTITIQNTTVKDIPYDSPVHLYGININDGNNIILKNNTFTNNSNAGFININFIDTTTSTPTYIIGNNITGDYCSEGYCVNSNGGPQNQVYLQNNYFNSSEGSSGIMLTNIAGGVITGNVIYNCYYGINLMSSSVDVQSNTIINSNNSKGIYSLSSSTANLSPSQSESGTEYVGGNNNISNEGSESNNIYVDNSYFYLDLGSNIFTITDSNTNHLSGWFPEGDYCGEDEVFNARYNCFYLNGNLIPKSDVTCGQNGTLMNFDFYSQNPTCLAMNDQYNVISLAEDIYDSIPVRSGGNGGGYKEGQAMAIQTSGFFKSLKDTIIINMRKKNYDLVITKCTQMLNYFPDSTFSIDALSKLYYSNLKLDNNGNKIGPLKTYFESLILNNQGKYSLISRTNYFIQKCKVVLKQYTSALQGFQEIINQNPYSFEGLVASWDYAATTLLANSSGGIKGYLQLNYNETSEESNLSLYSMIDTLRNRKVNASTYTTDDFDKKVFSKKDRETLQNNVESMYKNERTKQINKLQDLEKKSKSDNESISKKSKSELKIMKTLGEVVKVKKPNTMFEHIKNVKKDISKVLVVEKTSGKKTNTLVPQDYSLSQNYPNPFNPVTKINYELPKDGKVKLVIYDILGREMKSLVNNEFKTAGRYTVEFNGAQFASGVYFYRIQVEGGKGFTAVKKMVLIK